MLPGILGEFGGRERSITKIINKKILIVKMLPGILGEFGESERSITQKK
jgi:hypothetical protein